jgi:hypothetical protein
MDAVANQGMWSDLTLMKQIGERLRRASRQVARCRVVTPSIELHAQLALALPIRAGRMLAPVADQNDQIRQP